MKKLHSHVIKSAISAYKYFVQVYCKRNTSPVKFHLQRRRGDKEQHKSIRFEKIRLLHAFHVFSTVWLCFNLTTGAVGPKCIHIFTIIRHANVMSTSKILFILGLVVSYIYMYTALHYNNCFALIWFRAFSSHTSEAIIIPSNYYYYYYYQVVILNKHCFHFKSRENLIIIPCVIKT